VSFSLDSKKSADGSLSVEIQDRGIQVLTDLLKECERLEVKEMAAIATEVFRKAPNGALYLKRVKEELQLDVRVVTQEDEATLGFSTAVALQGVPPEQVRCWDSGGGSFQIISLGPNETFQTFLAPLGSGNTTAMLVQDIQGKVLAEHPSPNPVSAEQASAMMPALQKAMLEAPEWLKDASVTAIGGPNSMFAMAADIIGSKTYSQADVKKALETTIDCSDDELASRHCQGSNRDPPSACCPKMCLLLAVFEHCHIAEVSFQAAIGSCPGLLVSNELFSGAA